MSLLLADKVAVENGLDDGGYEKNSRALQVDLGMAEQRVMVIRAQRRALYLRWVEDGQPGKFI